MITELTSAYTKLLLGCTTPNQVNALQTRFENSMTPLEIFAIAAASAFEPAPVGSDGGPVDGALQHASTILRDTLLLIPPVHRTYALRWIATMQAFMSMSAKERPEPFHRRTRGPHASIYSNMSPSRDKCLLICFTGASGRLMVPVGVFLQNVDASQYDALVLRDVARNGFRHGIPGVADSLEELIQIIGANRRQKYARVVSVGISGGGMAAIWAALQLDLDKGVNIGGNHPADKRWQLWGDEGIKSPFDYFLARLTRPPNLLYAYGADQRRDVEAAGAIKELLPVRTIAVEGDGIKPSGHNALFTLLQRSALTGFLEEALSNDESWDRLSAFAANGATNSRQGETGPIS